MVKKIGDFIKSEFYPIQDGLLDQEKVYKACMIFRENIRFYCSIKTNSRDEAEELLNECTVAFLTDLKKSPKGLLKRLEDKTPDECQAYIMKIAANTSCNTRRKLGHYIETDDKNYDKEKDGKKFKWSYRELPFCSFETEDLDVEKYMDYLSDKYGEKNLNVEGNALNLASLIEAVNVVYNLNKYPLDKLTIYLYSTFYKSMVTRGYIISEHMDYDNINIYLGINDKYVLYFKDKKTYEAAMKIFKDKYVVISEGVQTMETFDDTIISSENCYMENIDNNLKSCIKALNGHDIQVLEAPNDKRTNIFDYAIKHTLNLNSPIEASIKYLDGKKFKDINTCIEKDIKKLYNGELNLTRKDIKTMLSIYFKRMRDEDLEDKAINTQNLDIKSVESFCYRIKQDLKKLNMRRGYI